MCRVATSEEELGELDIQEERKKSFRQRRSARNKRLIQRRGSNRSSKQRFRRKVPSGTDEKNTIGEKSTDQQHKKCPKNLIPKVPEKSISPSQTKKSPENSSKSPKLKENLQAQSQTVDQKSKDTDPPKVEIVDEGANRLTTDQKLNQDPIKLKMVSKRQPTQTLVAEVKVQELRRSESVTSSTETLNGERLRKISEKAKSKQLPIAPRANFAIPVNPDPVVDEIEVPEIPEVDPTGPVFDTKSLLMEKTTPISTSFADLRIEPSENDEADIDKIVKSEKKEENLEEDSSSVTTECRKVGRKISVSMPSLRNRLLRV